ncbi:MAG TPA: 16S rRNA (guanine(966)-N(2))-methyltransferase RsmD [Longimicrobiales bacterium]|nr:16S rRNA (guanine(966)-N(2))-methyltransferase RsmD [Longimicrobiales bacterium]
MRIIAGTWRGRRLKAVRGRDVRPTSGRVREAWMSALGGDLTGLEFADLFAGSGALGLEALSRGAARAVFVEKARGALRVLEANIALLGCGDRATVIRGDALVWAEGHEADTFDVALADPPYDRGWAGRLLELFHRHPFARELWVEHRSGEPLPDLPGLRSRRYGDTTLTTLARRASE